MAAFWGFLTALVCTAMFVFGAITGYVLAKREHDTGKSFRPYSDYTCKPIDYSKPYRGINKWYVYNKETDLLSSSGTSYRPEEVFYSEDCTLVRKHTGFDTLYIWDKLLKNWCAVTFKYGEASSDVDGDH